MNNAFNYDVTTVYFKVVLLTEFSAVSVMTVLYVKKDGCTDEHHYLRRISASLFVLQPANCNKSNSIDGNKDK